MRFGMQSGVRTEFGHNDFADNGSEGVSLSDQISIMT